MTRGEEEQKGLCKVAHMCEIPVTTCVILLNGICYQLAASFEESKKEARQPTNPSSPMPAIKILERLYAESLKHM